MNIHEKINAKSWLNPSSRIKGGFIRMRKYVKQSQNSEMPYYPDMNTFGSARIDKAEFFKLKF